MGSGLPSFMVGKSVGDYLGQSKKNPPGNQKPDNNTGGSLNPQISIASSRDSMINVDYFSEPTSLQCSSLNSYTSLAGFQLQPEKKNPKDEANPALLQKLELQGKINEIVQNILNPNTQLFIRSVTLSMEDQVKVFGEPVFNTGEVLSAQGTRVLLMGRIDYWRNFCNLNEPPAGHELQRFCFVNEEGEKIFLCSLYTDIMKIQMGTLFIGQLTMKKKMTLDCSDWDLSTLTVEDRYSDQVLRFERNKSQFDVLLYPEQLKLCQISCTRWNAKEFPFLSSDKRVFSIPLPDEFLLTFRKKALLLTSSIYLYDKYYQKSKKCRIFIGIFAFFSVILIVTLIVVLQTSH